MMGHGTIRRGRILVVGAGIQGLTIVCKLLTHAAESGSRIHVVVAASRFDRATTSQSGGYFLPFLNDDARVPDWCRVTEAFWRWVRANEPQLARFVASQPSLLVSRADQPIVPPGHLGDAVPAEPVGWGLPFYRSARLLTDGLVISTCGMVEAFSAYLFSQPNVTKVVTPVLTIGEIADLAAAHRAGAVVLATGLGSRELLGDRALEGTEGILLFGQLPGHQSIHARMTVMDEDDPAELTYSIPHWACASHQLVVGGIAVHREPTPADEDGGGSERLTPERLADADAILARARHRFPDLADWKPTRAWVGWRPSRSEVRVELLDLDVTLGVPMIAAYGAGGSGWTICAGVAEDVVGLLTMANL